ncbi:hypothetical protein GCM10008094_31270 [Aidingimonas halophila]|nr:hypothetical protein GCM10008094_31270 [Aidingimonas halophila]
MMVSASSDSTTQGTLAIIAAVTAMATGDAFIKFFADTVPLDGLIAGRSIFAVVLLVPLTSMIRLGRLFKAFSGR